MANIKEAARRAGSAVNLNMLSEAEKEFAFVADHIDEDWYFKQYPEVKRTGMSAQSHYMRTGYKEDKSPSPLFDAEFYIEQYPDVKNAGIPAIVHYTQHGGSEWRRPNPFVDMDRYYELFGENVAATDTHTILDDFYHSEDRSAAFRFVCQDRYEVVDPDAALTPNGKVEDFLLRGLYRGRDPHLLINLAALRLQVAPLGCRVQFSKLFLPDNELSQVDTHPVFDASFYLRKCGSLGEHPVIHYLRNWRHADLWPHPLFNAKWYARTAGLLKQRIDPLSHFLLEGEANGFWPNAFFDPLFYRKAYADKIKDGEHVLTHYMRMGHMKWFDPSDRFSQRYYLSRNPDMLTRREPLLVDYLHGGRDRGREALPPKPFFDKTEGLDSDGIVALIKAVAKPNTEPPLVSVIVPAYKNVNYTLRCIFSMLESGDTTPFEIIVADDQSPDQSGEYLSKALEGVPRVRVHINPENLGFLRSCNAAVERSTAKYVFFLNNDTAVLPGWLDEMSKTFKLDPYIGMVGSKLIYPNGLLQEAGGIIYGGGACANYGRLDDPAKPEYNFMRDADYISGASIMVLRKLWDHVGAFSEELAPAYYEDTDIAMKVRHAGMRVVYQPRSVVVHYEGISSGTDTGSGIKRFQVINREKFAKKWAETLESHATPGEMSRFAVDRQVKGRILIFDAETPKPDRDSGSITAFFYMKLLSELGYRVTFVPENLLWDGAYSRALQAIGVEVIHVPFVTNARQYILENAEQFDMFILSRVFTGGAFFSELKSAAQDTPIVFDTVDLHHLRMLREAELAGDPDRFQRALETKQLELDIIQRADATLIVSEHEVEYLNDEIGPFPSVVIPLIYAEYERKTGFEERRDVAFVGGYRHPPNIDAVEYLVNDLWPRIRDLNLDCKLHIIGSHMPAEFQKFADDDIVVVGFVEDLESYLSKIRLTVAPLRYGAGVKGKVGNSLRMGVPVVGTRVATEGMGLVPETHVLVGDDPASFVNQVQRVYSDPVLWQKISAGGKAFVDDRFGQDAAKAKLEALTRVLIRKPSDSVT